MSGFKVVRKFLLSAMAALLLSGGVLRAEDPADHVFDIMLNPPELMLSSALELERTTMDCSHLVHHLYELSGLEYDYANSLSLYKGVSEFQRVVRPQPGDLVVWRGHVGIVVNPEEQTFVSALRSGVKVASYVSHYWKRRGIPRFFHYVGNNAEIESSEIE